MKRLSERVATFLASEDGKKVVRREIHRRRARSDIFDDVVAGVHWRALYKERNQPDFEPEVLEAWTTRLVQRQVVDIYRGRSRSVKREGVLNAVADSERFWDQQADVAPEPDEEFEFETIDLADSAERVGAIRQRLAQALSRKPYPAAAAFCVVAMFCDGAEPAEDCPKPQGGVAESEAYWWAAVFYSGRTTCFPLDGAPEDAAMRQRRSRALRDTKELIEEAVDVR